MATAADRLQLFERRYAPLETPPPRPVPSLREVRQGLLDRDQPHTHGAKRSRRLTQSTRRRLFPTGERGGGGGLEFGAAGTWGLGSPHTSTSHNEAF